MAVVRDAVRRPDHLRLHARSSASTGRRSTSSPSTSTAPPRSPTGSPGWHPVALVAQGKPVAITEFGAATYRGAGDRGARGLEIVEWDEARAPVRLERRLRPRRGRQAAYLRELLDVFDAEGVDSAFVFTFALYDLPHRPDGDPRDDLDLASYGIVKVLEDRRGDTYPDMPWEPKAAFAAVAGHYGR